MKHDLYLDKYIGLLEQTARRAHKDLERERRRVDFLEGKVERLELVVMESKSDAGREYVARSDRAAAPPPRKPPITETRVEMPSKPSFESVKAAWNNLSAEEQQKAIDEGNLVVEAKGRPT